MLSLKFYREKKRELQTLINHICGEMFSMLASRVVDRGFEPRLGQSKVSTKHTLLRRKNKDWLARNHDNVSDLGLQIYLWTVV